MTITKNRIPSKVSLISVIIIIHSRYLERSSFPINFLNRCTSVSLNPLRRYEVYFSCLTPFAVSNQVNETKYSRYLRNASDTIILSSSMKKKM